MQKCPIVTGLKPSLEDSLSNELTYGYNFLVFYWTYDPFYFCPFILGNVNVFLKKISDDDLTLLGVVGFLRT